MTTIYYAQVQKNDGKWYYVALSPFYLIASHASAKARVTMQGNPKKFKDYRTTSREVNLDQFNNIID